VAAVAYATTVLVQTGPPLDRDVTRGKTVTHWFSAPSLFAGICGFPGLPGT
jgi:hypothetical protein